MSEMASTNIEGDVAQNAKKVEQLEQTVDQLEQMLRAAGLTPHSGEHTAATSANSGLAREKNKKSEKSGSVGCFGRKKKRPVEDSR